MKTIEISYNPYKMITKMLINQVDVCRNQSYEKFKDFIENEIPLQTWIEPIEYRDWAGFVNEISDPETNDEVKVIFSGRKIDFDDLKRAIADQNEDRSEETRVRYGEEYRKGFIDCIDNNVSPLTTSEDECSSEAYYQGLVDAAELRDYLEG